MQSEVSSAASKPRKSTASGKVRTKESTKRSVGPVVYDINDLLGEGATAKVYKGRVKKDTSTEGL